MRCRLTFWIRFQVSPDRLPIRSTLALNQEQILRCPHVSTLYRPMAFPVQHQSVDAAGTRRLGLVHNHFCRHIEAAPWLHTKVASSSVG